MSVAPRGSVALVTCAAYPDLADDDRLLLPALAATGFEPIARRWDEPDEPWARHAAVVVRSCWDYHRRPSEFHAWLDRLVVEGARVFNPVPILRWNADKRYLRDLADAGIEVVPTAWVEERDEGSLAALAGARGWDQVVVKPSVSATAFETWRAGPVVTDDDERRFQRLTGERPVLVQPYLPEIEGGELSLVFLGGHYSHAVLKRPRPGDFRVQVDFGGTVEPIRADPQVIEAATRVLRAAPGDTLYARVDLCLVAGRVQLMELELLEPALFFATEPAASARFAEALVRARFTRETR
jgi:glutathione synthase/RimK-type ligase-like ATP-grasp enzyme